MEAESEAETDEALPVRRGLGGRARSVAPALHITDIFTQSESKGEPQKEADKGPVRMPMTNEVEKEKKVEKGRGMEEGRKRRCR